MTPETFKAIRQRAGMTQSQVAEFLCLEANGGRYIRAIERGDRNASGPVAKLMRLLDEGVIGPHAWPHA